MVAWTLRARLESLRARQRFRHMLNESGFVLALGEFGKCGGHSELRPEVVALAKQLRRKRPKGGQRSLRDISRELAALGHLNEIGKPFSAVSVRNMLAA
jgi:hypothetical protein